MMKPRLLGLDLIILCGLSIAWGVVMGVLPARGIFLAHFVWVAFAYGWMIAMLVIKLSRSVLLVALSTGTAFLVFWFLPVYDGKSVGISWASGDRLWPLVGITFWGYVLQPVFFTWIIQESVQHVIRLIQKYRGRA